MQLSYEEGTRLILELKCGQIYEGTYILCTHNRIDVCDVVEYPQRGNIPGDRSFYKHEFHRIAVLYETMPDPNTLKERIVAMPIQELEQLMNMAINYIYLPVMDRRYVAAINDLNHAETIGVAGFWDKFGRFREITLLVLATPEKVYIFDLKFYGRTIFPTELKSILESNCQKKILHDAQRISDALHHVHQVKMNYVCDTQVWDYSILYKLKKQRLQNYRSLSECLAHYFNIPDMVNAEYIHEEDWLQRPLIEETKFLASRLAAYLIVLHKKQEWILEKDFGRFSKSYMNGTLDVTPLASPLL